MLVLRQQLAAGHAHALQHGVRLRDKFLPVLALGVGRIGNKNAIVGRIFVGGDVEFACKKIGAVKEILPVVISSGGLFDWRSCKYISVFVQPSPDTQSAASGRLRRE